MEAKDVRFKIQILNLEAHPSKNFFRRHFVLIGFKKKHTCFKRKLVFFKIIFNFYNPGSGSKFNVFGSTTLRQASPWECKKKLFIGAENFYQHL